MGEVIDLKKISDQLEREQKELDDKRAELRILQGEIDQKTAELRKLENERIKLADDIARKEQGVARDKQVRERVVHQLQEMDKKRA